uniref:Uncharacterized protein n=1 Tax=Klebsiella pneumoniae TaxID=573 RepID=A0A8B0SUY8_KLEPN|nr:hypothetical protein [Klebsiella pneumoniae]
MPNSRHRYAASTSGNPSFSVLRQLQYLCELTQEKKRLLLTPSCNVPFEPF